MGFTWYDAFTMIKINYKGMFDITASSPAEAAAIIRELDASARAELPNKSLPSVQNQDLFQPASEDVAIIAFLKRVLSDKGGTTAEDIMPILGAVSPRGLGGRMARVNSVLSELGFEKSDVYNNESRGAKGRVWKPGPKIQEAIDKVSERISN